MIGLVLVAHGRLGQALVEAAELILGQRLAGVASVAVEIGQKPEQLRAALAEAVAKADSGQGVLILVDMFGGSPSDMSISFLEKDKREVLTGVNLPMLLHLATSRQKAASLTALAKETEKRAVDSIALASRLLGG